MDYYLLASLLDSGYAPRVVATEYAAHMGHQLALTRPYSPTFAAAATSFQYGASLLAFVKLMRRHEYRFIGCVEWNAYFLRSSVKPSYTCSFMRHRHAWSGRATSSGLRVYACVL